MSFEFDIDDRAAVAYFGRFKADFETAFFTKLQLRIAQRTIGEIRRQIASWTSKTGSRKTGQLARSWTPVFRVRDGQREIGIFSDAPHARIHQWGGPIVPSKARALTIPITNQARRRPARDWNSLKLIHHPPALPILATVRKKQIKPQFILKRRVYITPKMYLTKAKRAVQPQIVKMVRSQIIKSFKAASKG